MEVGICRLTGVRGRFVRSHIIPAALTRPDHRGAPFVQAGVNYRAIRRWTSWYDEGLVIQKGANILRDYDTFAINELRNHQLIWGSWGNSKSLLVADHQRIPDTPYGPRVIEGIDQRRLRLFFLSVLWRAAVTTLPEFAEIVLSSEDLELLRRMVLDGCTEPVDFYPIHLVQLSTRGLTHNHNAITRDVEIRSQDGETERLEPIFRFYFDGLAIHITRQSNDDGITEQFGGLVLGNTDKLVVTTVTFEESAQRKMLLHVMQEMAGRKMTTDLKY